MDTPARFRFPFAPVGLLLILVALVGCDSRSQIRTYRVPKEVRAAARTPTHRMLAAIVPVGDQAWFFKSVAETDVIAKLEQAINDFFSQLTVDGGKVVWQAPEGWQEISGSGMRAATFRIPHEDGDVEMSVLRLPWSQSQERGVLANVNRWRGQMQLASIGPIGLDKCTKPLEIEGTEAVLVDLAGRWQDSGMAAPFAQGEAMAERPKPAAIGKGDAPLELIPPEGWQPGRLNTMRKAAYNVSDGDQKAEVTVMDFPATDGSPMADPLANVNRWRGELGLRPIDESQIDETTEVIEIDGILSTFVALLEDTQNSEGTLVAMVPRDGLMWFFKMKGDRELVAQQEGNFRKFLDSVRFASGGGEQHGNN